jgi:hypothetical protein
MPMPHSSHAPRFTGIASEIRVFFQFYEHRAALAGLNDEQMIEMVIVYLDAVSQGIWSQYDEYINRNVFSWNQFKARAFQDYPEAHLSRTYSIPEFDAFVSEWAQRGIWTVASLDEFTRLFQQYASNIKRQGLCAEFEINRKYQSAFTTSIGSFLALQLRISYPMNPNPSFNDIRTTARFLLENWGPQAAGANQFMGVLPPAPTPPMWTGHQQMTPAMAQPSGSFSPQATSRSG